MAENDKKTDNTELSSDPSTTDQGDNIPTSTTAADASVSAPDAEHVEAVSVHKADAPTTDKQSSPSATKDEASADGLTEDSRDAVPVEPSSVRPSAIQEEHLEAEEPAKGVGLLVVILIALAASAPGAWMLYQAKTNPNPMVVMQTRLAKQDEKLDEMLSEQARLKSTMPSAQEIKGWQQPVEQLSAQNQSLSKQLNHVTIEVQRLAEVDADARKTWQLAEAHYLIRLASQRLIIDRSAEGSLALLEAADNILRDMDDVSLFPVRESLADDMTQLQQVVPVDQAGIYLRLSSIAKEVLNIPELPANRTVSGESVPTGVEKRIQDLSSIEAPVFWDTVKLSFWKSVAVVSRHIRVRDHDQPFRPMMSLNQSEIVRANIRLSIQQAQLAMLREDEKIYRQSIDDAVAMLQMYFPNQTQATSLIAQLNDVKGRQVVLQLPPLTQSIDVLERWQADQDAKAWREARGLNPATTAQEGNAQ